MTAVVPRNNLGTVLIVYCVPPRGARVAPRRIRPNPADNNLYQGEIRFYDFYIIPLAMKLKSGGVFGVSSDEYLSYAQQNRHEWELKGKEFLAAMVDK